MVKDREAWCAAVHGTAKLDATYWLNSSSSQCRFPPSEAAASPVAEDGRGSVATGCVRSLLSVAVRGLMHSCRTFWSTQGTEPVSVQTPWVSWAPSSPELTPWPWAALRQPLLELSMRLPLPPRLCPWRKLVVIFSRHHNEIDRTSFYPFKICWDLIDAPTFPKCLIWEPKK